MVALESVAVVAVLAVTELRAVLRLPREALTQLLLAVVAAVAVAVHQPTAATPVLTALFLMVVVEAVMAAHKMAAAQVETAVAVVAVFIFLTETVVRLEQRVLGKAAMVGVVTATMVLVVVAQVAHLVLVGQETVGQVQLAVLAEVQ